MSETEQAPVPQVVHQAVPLIMNAVVVRPGDTLIITTDRSMSDDEVDVMRERIQELIDVKVMLFEEVTGLAVYRPAPETD